MRILNEYIFRDLTWKDFSISLCELLSKTDSIEDAPEYVTRYIEPYQDTPQKRKEYARHPKIREIKKDINDFTKEWIKNIKSKRNVIKVDVNPSPYFGLSEYVYIDIGISNPKLQNFYDNNANKYNRVKFRFTDHGDIEYAAQKSDAQVEYDGRSFLQAAKEMEDKIYNYLTNLHDEELKELKRIKNRERRKRKNLKMKQMLNNQNNTTESYTYKRLQISESNKINEKLEKISNATYCTDYVGDITNWILNRPKSYRILYDSEFDVWCIADALEKTHWQMAQDLFKSGYLLGVRCNIEQWIENAREKDDYDSDYSNSEVYAGYGFDHKLIGGLFFIPNNENYRKYEESGLYSVPTEIESGTIYSRRDLLFDESGLFRDLYIKLKRLNALKG